MNTGNQNPRTSGRGVVNLSIVLAAVPAGTARLARVGRIDCDQLAAISGQRVAELAPEFAPALIEDAFV